MELSLILIVVAVIFVTFSAILKRYRRCPSDKVMVIYGKTGKNKSGSISSARCIHGGAAFVWPVFQDYAFLDLKPISIECNLTNALSKQNIRVDVPCRFTVGISTEPDSMTNAAERLLGLSIDNIQNIATDILFGQLRLVIATMDIEEINSDRDKFLVAVSQNVEAELRKIGLKLINVNVTDELAAKQAIMNELLENVMSNITMKPGETKSWNFNNVRIPDKDAVIYLRFRMYSNDLPELLDVLLGEKTCLLGMADAVEGQAVDDSHRNHKDDRVHKEDAQELAEPQLPAGTGLGDDHVHLVSLDFTGEEGAGQPKAGGRHQGDD